MLLKMGGFEGGEKDQGEASMGKAREKPLFLLPQQFCCLVDLGLGRADEGDGRPREATAGRRAGRSGMREHRGRTGERTAGEVAYRCRAWKELPILMRPRRPGQAMSA
jgi:hypothetical protein